MKNLHRPDKVSTKPWAYYEFDMDNSNPPKMPDSAKAQVDENCYDCHYRVNKDTDNVWVQFYPILQNMKK